MNDQELLYIFIEPDTTTNAYYKDDGIIDVQIFALTAIKFRVIY